MKRAEALREYVRALPVVAWCTVAAACAGSPPPPQEAPGPVELRVTFVAAADINPDPGGRPSPIALRLFVLTDGAAFGSSGFANLAENRDPALATTRIGEKRLTLRPGESLEIPIGFPSTANEIGVFAEYSDPLSSTWRARLVVRDLSTRDVAPDQRILISVERSRVGASMQVQEP